MPNIGERTRERWRLTLPWLYAILAFGCAVVIADTYLIPQAEFQTINTVDEHRVQVGGRRSSHVIHWSVVTLSEGTKLQVERRADSFLIGDTVDVRLSRILDLPMSYRVHRWRSSSWVAVDTYKSDYRPFPFAALFCSILLLLPFWPTEVRWLIQGLLVIVLVAWFFMLLGTSVLARFSY